MAATDKGSGDPLAASAWFVINHALRQIPEAEQAEFLELLGAGVITKMRELHGKEFVEGFLDAAKADNQNEA